MAEVPDRNFAAVGGLLEYLREVCHPCGLVSIDSADEGWALQVSPRREARWSAAHFRGPDLWAVVSKALLHVQSSPEEKP